MIRARIAPLPLALLLAALVTPVQPGDTAAMCCPFPCDDCALLSFGQMNFVVMDRAARRIRLIPNIRIVGDAPEFSLVIPTPTPPALEPAPKEIWAELSALTAPVISNGSDDGGFFGCASEDVAVVAADNLGGGADRTDVEIISRQTVGAFIATTLSSEVPDALVRWLRDNGYPVSETEAAAFVPLVERNWVFTAMKLDSSRPEGRMPDGGWNNAVDPVQLSFSSTTLDVPLDMLAINRGDQLPMAFFVVDDHRTTLAGFTTNYADRLTRTEQSRLTNSHPHLARYLGAGRFLTRLDRTFTVPEPMTGIVTLKRAASDTEYRRVRSATSGAIGVENLLWLALPWIGRRRSVPRRPG